jgi:hypothetical protein
MRTVGTTSGDGWEIATRCALCSRYSIKTRATGEGLLSGGELPIAAKVEDESWDKLVAEMPG